MKKTLCVLIALLLFSCAAYAETNIIENPSIIIEMITPAPTAEPVGETFSTEDMIVTLPAGMAILAEEERVGYDAAAAFDYPNAGQTVLLAVDFENGAALTFSILEDSQTAAAAAGEAALSIPDAEAVEEITLGENAYAAFRCTIGIDEMRIFYLSNGQRLLCVGACGVEDEALDTMLTGLIF